MACVAWGRDFKPHAARAAHVAHVIATFHDFDDTKQEERASLS